MDPVKRTRENETIDSAHNASPQCPNEKKVQDEDTRRKGAHRSHPPSLHAPYGRFRAPRALPWSLPAPPHARLRLPRFPFQPPSPTLTATGTPFSMPTASTRHPRPSLPPSPSRPPSRYLTIVGACHPIMSSRRKTKKKERKSDEEPMNKKMMKKTKEVTKKTPKTKL